MISSEQAKKLFGLDYFSFEDYLAGKMAYQEVGEQFLIDRKHAFLIYEPGKGKTYPTIAAMREVDAVKNGCAKVLILSTKSALDKMWHYEIVPQGILPENTVLVNFELAITDKMSRKLLGIKWDIIVVDESHKIKSHNAQISKLVYRLTKRVEYAWGLTGTARGNSDLDVFCQFHNMNVSEWGDISYSRFVDTCCDVEQKYGAGRQYKNILGISERYRAGWERNLAMYTQRVSYDESDEMPPLNFRPIALPYVKSDEYINAEKGFIALSDYETTMIRLTALQKMHQAANGFLYYTSELTGKRCTHKIQYNMKLAWIKANLTREPTVIVYLYEEDLNELKKTFPSATESIDDFKARRSEILLLQCSQCESFNLQMCRKLIFYTMDYSFLKFKQMMHRVWRKGQELDTEVIILMFKGTVEVDIWNAVKSKKRLADIFMSVKGAA